MSLVAILLLAGISTIRAQTRYDRLALANYYQKQDFDGAISYLTVFAAQEAESVSFNNDLGYALYMSDEYKRAKFYFEKARKKKLSRVASGTVEFGSMISLLTRGLFYLPKLTNL